MLFFCSVMYVCLQICRAEQVSGVRYQVRPPQDDTVSYPSQHSMWVVALAILVASPRPPRQTSAVSIPASYIDITRLLPIVRHIGSPFQLVSERCWAAKGPRLAPSQSPSPCLAWLLVSPALDESNPPCASGPSSPCHPLHREPCESNKNRAFGDLHQGWRPRGGPAAATVTHCQVLSPTTWSLFSLSFSLSFFPSVSALRLSFVPQASFFVRRAPRFPSFWLLARSSARCVQSPARQRLTRRLSTCAPALWRPAVRHEFHPVALI